jgi:hypothetical protein
MVRNLSWKPLDLSTDRMWTSNFESKLLRTRFKTGNFLVEVPYRQVWAQGIWISVMN